MSQGKCPKCGTLVEYTSPYPPPCPVCKILEQEEHELD